MINIFKKRKLYRVIWVDIHGDEYVDIVSARNPHHAINKTKNNIFVNSIRLISEYKMED